MANTDPDTDGRTPTSEPLTFVSIESAVANPFAPMHVIVLDLPTLHIRGCGLVLSAPREPMFGVITLNVSLKSSGC